MKQKIEETVINKCKICGSTTTELLDAQLKVTYDVCHKCDFISKQKDYHLNPNIEKQRYSTHNNFPSNEGYVKIFKSMLELHVKPLKNVKKALDFGSGPYPTLKLMLSDMGFEAHDFDPFFNNNDEFKDHKYDLITTTEVIEHMSDPMKELELLISLLNNNGYLLIMTNYRKMDLEEFLKWWYRRDHTHVSFFNERTFNYIKDYFSLIEVSNNNKNIIVLQKK